MYAGLGSAIGASITYWVARIGGRSMVDRFAKFFRIDLRYIERIEEQVRRRGAGIVLVGRVLPGLRTFVSIPAGLVKIPFPKFFLATFVGAYVWCTLLIGAGYILGHEWMLISDYIKTHLPLVFVLVLLAVASYFLYQYRAYIPAFSWMRSKTKRLDKK
jgi:membrane protein DedA with SNARE-associated domain